MLTPTINFQIQNEDYKTNLFMKDMKRKDGGKYTLTATNNSGTDKCDVEVTVLSKPTAPQGPLEIKDVYADHMTLEWKPPEDDGGLPVDYYEVSKKMKNK